MRTGEDPIMSDQQQYKYMTVDDIRGLDDEQRHLNTTGGSTNNETKDQTDNCKTAYTSYKIFIVNIYIYSRDSYCWRNYQTGRLP